MQLLFRAVIMGVLLAQAVGAAPLDVEECTIYGLADVRIGGHAQMRGAVASAESPAVVGNARVWYPSVLWLCPYRPARAGTAGQALVADDDAVVYGVLVAAGRDAYSVHAAVYLGGASAVHGVVYTDGAVTLFGGTRGTVYANRIVYRVDGRFYDGCVRETLVRSEDLSMMVVPMAFRCARRLSLLSLETAG